MKPVPTEDDLVAREEALRQREAEMGKREADLRVKEAQISGLKPNNWPFPCKPFNWTYHSIPDDIPAPAQSLVKHLYVMCILTWIGIFIGTLALLVALEDPSYSFSLWVIVQVVGIPGAWVLWYRSIYYGISRRSNLRWLCFFAAFFCHVVYSGMNVLGLPSNQFAGIFFAISRKDHPVTLIFTIVNTVFWIPIFLYSWILLKRARDFWKSSGAEKSTRAIAGQAATAIKVQQSLSNPGSKGYENLAEAEV
jgi:secretory carrier-associated membrane protein